MENINKLAHPAGRVLLGLLFAVSGFTKITMLGAAGVGGYIESVIPGLGFLAWPVMIYELVAGVALIVGFKTRLTALSLVPFCLFTGIVFHGFSDMNGLLKNVALAGGYLLLFRYGAGGKSLDKS